MTDFDLTTMANSLAGSPIVETLGWVLFHSVWQLALVSIAIKLLMLLISQRFSNTRYAIALVGMCLAVVIPIVTFGLVEPALQLPVENIGVVSIDDTAFTFAADRTLTSVEVEPQTWSELAREHIGPWLPLLTAAWILGVCLFSIRPAFGIFTVSKMKRSGTSPVSEDVNAQFQKLIKMMRFRRPIRLMQSTMTGVPMVVGFFKPMVLLPASTLTNLSASELEAILAHELAHLRRYDDFVNLGQTIIESIFFYHPCVWWMSTLVRAERENCCDDAAVSVTGAKPLAQALLRLEDSRVRQPALSANGGSLVKRIRRLSPSPISQPNSHRHGNPWVYFATCVTLISMCGIFGFLVDGRLEAFIPPAPQSPEGDNEFSEASLDLQADSFTHEIDNSSGGSNFYELQSDQVQEPSGTVKARKNPLQQDDEPQPRSVSDALQEFDRELQHDSSGDDKETTSAEFVESITLNHRDADAVADSVSSMFAGTAGMGKLEISLDESNKILVLHASQKSGVGYAKNLIKLFDVPHKEFKPIASDKMPRVVSFSAKNRKADELVVILKAIFEKQAPQLKVHAEKKSNQVVVVAEQSLIEEIRTLISLLDKHARMQTPKPEASNFKLDSEVQTDSEPDKLPRVRVSSLGQTSVAVDRHITIMSEFPVAEVMIREPNHANVRAQGLYQIRVEGLKPGIAYLELNGAQGTGQSKRYKITIKERNKDADSEFRKLQTEYFRERSAMERLVNSSSGPEAIERLVALQIKIQLNDRIGDSQKTLLMKVADRDIAACRKLFQNQKTQAAKKLKTKTVNLQPGSAVNLQSKIAFTEVLVSRADVVNVIPLGIKEIQVVATTDMEGTCELELLDEKNNVVGRYLLHVEPVKPEDHKN